MVFASWKDLFVSNNHSFVAIFSFVLGPCTLRPVNLILLIIKTRQHGNQILHKVATKLDKKRVVRGMKKYGLENVNLNWLMPCRPIQLVRPFRHPAVACQKNWSERNTLRKQIGRRKARVLCHFMHGSSIQNAQAATVSWSMSSFPSARGEHLKTVNYFYADF